ncbi:uncharacterized protein LOC123684289 [Harmonia axyridis]|uniref:uncharacterized protein LOC123684289 n=1 Tax=Harmonia axyridis TaxID=115357 RepID=UPI001E279477|nr:uncharacterized protein LOC123684289 [Harmonia axyridis]
MIFFHHFVGFLLRVNMLLKTILLLCLFGYYNCAPSKEQDMEPASTNVKEITVSIEHNSDDSNPKSTDDSKKNPLSKRTRANLLLNSKVVYPPGAKSASAFNQGILKFQQLLELPLNETNSDLMEITNNKFEEAFNKSSDMESEIKNSTITDEMETKKTSNCGNSTIHKEDGDSSLKILKNKFIEDFGTTGENILDIISKNGENQSDSKVNSTEKTSGKTSNKTADVEFIEPVTLKPSNVSVNQTESKKSSSIEILDDDMEDESNSTDTKTQTSRTNQTSSYLPAERKSSDSKIIEVKPQEVQEIPLNPSFRNSARKEDRSDEDDISQNIKRDILLGNLNPFFSNPSTNSIRNTNSIFFDDMLKKSGGLIGPMNPFVINSISFDGSKSKSSTSSSFGRLKNAPKKSSGSVKTLKSIALSEDNSSSSFGSKLGGHSATLGGFSSNLGSSPSFSSLGSHSSKKANQPARLGTSTVRGRRPNFSRFRNKPAKASKGTVVETVSSIPLGDGKEDTSSSFNFASTPSFSSHKSSVKTVPSLLLRQEDESPKFSSTYRSNKPTAVSSASFSFTPSGTKSRSHGRSKSFPSFSKPRSHSKPVNSYSKPPPASKSSDSAEEVEILKSVDYSLPEEVGKSLAKTGPAKFKRTAGFEPRKVQDYSMQASVSVDPMLLNFDMSHKSQDHTFNPYLVNAHMKPVKRTTERSRSFEFRPSQPDSKTRKVKEFSLDQQKKTYFQPSLRFKTITEIPLIDTDMFDGSDYGSEEDGAENLQTLENFENDMIFKPYFATNSPKSFHMSPTEKSGRSPRSFNIPEVNFFVTQSPRSFQMPEPSTYKYFGNVHMIDLS